MRKPELAGMGLVAELVRQNIGQLLGPIVFGQLVYQIGWVFTGYEDPAMSGRLYQRLVRIR